MSAVGASGKGAMLGLNLRPEFRSKCAEQPVGKFWLEVAELVIEAMSTGGEDARASQPKGPIQ